MRYGYGDTFRHELPVLPSVGLPIEQDPHDGHGHDLESPDGKQPSPVPGVVPREFFDFFHPAALRHPHDHCHRPADPAESSLAEGQEVEGVGRDRIGEELSAEEAVRREKTTAAHSAAALRSKVTEVS